MFEGFVALVIWSSITLMVGEHFDKENGIKKTGYDFCVIIQEESEAQSKMKLVDCN